MVRNYEKKTVGPKWTEEEMKDAVDEVKKRLSVCAAAKKKKSHGRPYEDM